MPGIQKILIAEDNIALSKLYSEYLIKNGYEVRVAENGFKALELVRENKPDMAFVDVMMPGMGGFELVKNLRHKEEYGCTHIKIVLLTNLGKDQVPEEIENDVDGYALKAAIQLTDLIQIIKSFNENGTEGN